MIACLLLLAGPWSAAGAVGHGHQEPGTAAAAAANDAAIPADRWQADAALARGMKRVRTATRALAHAGHGHLDAPQVRGIAAELAAAVDAMFAECRLEPGPDAALHALLVRVLAASRALSAGDFDADALADLEEVLVRYGASFDDAAWRDAE